MRQWHALANLSFHRMPGLFTRRFAFVWFCGCLVLVSHTATAADERARLVLTPEEQAAARASELVRQLGAKTFAARQRAQRELVGLGIAAKPELQAACDSADAEIRRRARQALASILDLDFQTRLEAFLAEGAGPDGHGLPCWNDYRRLAGEGPLARRLFGDMQRVEHLLLQAVDDNPKRAGEVLEARCLEVGQEFMDAGAATSRSASVPPTTLAALLLAAANDEVPIAEPVGNFFYHVCQPQALERSLLARNTGDTLRRLFAAWVARPLNPDSLTAYRNLLRALENDVKEALTPAAGLLSGGGAPAHFVPWAILTVGRFGGREHIALLEPLLNDERNIAVPNRGAQNLDAQVRDVALAVIVHLSGQPLADYGFTHARAHPSCLFVADSLGFSDPAARDRAFQRWREWSAEHRAENKQAN